MNSLGAAEHVAPAHGLHREGVALPDSGLRALAGAVVLSSRSVATLLFMCSARLARPDITGWTSVTVFRLAGLLQDTYA